MSLNRCQILKLLATGVIGYGLDLDLDRLLWVPGEKTPDHFKRMTFLERYNQELTWYNKVIIMEIYHLTMSSHNKNWTITKTAEYFDCSIGLVSENIRLADAFHNNSALLKSNSRQEALKKLNNEKGI